MLGPDGMNWSWSRPREGLNDRIVSGIVKFGGGNVMMWGCMTYDGIGFSCKIDTTLNAELYTKIL